MDKVLDVREAAEYLRINDQTLRRLARDGEIPAFKVGRSWRFKRETLDAWAAGQSAPTLRESAKRILVVDDEDVVREFLSALLEREGFAVTTAKNGAEALECLEGEEPDLIFLDLIMPQMNGAEALRHIRQRHPSLPVVILTAYPESELVADALPFSPVTLLVKPASTEQIRTCVKQLIPNRTEP